MEIVEETNRFRTRHITLRTRVLPPPPPWPPSFYYPWTRYPVRVRVKHRDIPIMFGNIKRYLRGSILCAKTTIPMSSIIPSGENSYFPYTERYRVTHYSGVRSNIDTRKRIFFILLRCAKFIVNKQLLLYHRMRFTATIYSARISYVVM